MKHKLKALVLELGIPVIVVFLVSVVLVTLNILLAQRGLQFTSDDVSWQVILATWHPFSGHAAYLGTSDNYVLKIPFFWFFGHLFAPTRKLLTLESAMLCVLGITLMYFSSIYFLKKLRIKLSYVNLLPFIWLASLSTGVDTPGFYLNPIDRNVELGFSFVFFVLAAKLIYKEINPLKTWLGRGLSLLVCIVAGSLIYNDPYFLYFTIVPILALFSVLALVKKVSIKQWLWIVIGIAVSFVFTGITSYLAKKAGVVLTQSELVQFVGFNNIASNVVNTFQALLNTFDANFFGGTVTNLITITAALNFLLVVIVLYKISRLKHESGQDAKNKISPTTLWKMFFGLLCIFVLGVLLISTQANPYNFRYLFMMLLASTLFLSFVLGQAKNPWRQVLCVVLAVTIVGNLYVAISDFNTQKADGASNASNQQNYAMVNTVRGLGLTKGYATYWDSDINTYLSGNTIQFLPMVCTRDKTVPQHFLIDSRQFEIQAKSSFLLIDPVYGTTSFCTMQQLAKQFGQPRQTLHLGNETLLIYNYDIFTKMPLVKNS